MRLIRPGMPGGPRMPVGQGVGKPAGMAPGMPSGPRMPVAQGVGKPATMGAGTQVYTPRPGSPETTLPARPANLTPQANQPDPQLQFQSNMRDALGVIRGMGGMKKGGKVKMKSGGKVSGASKRADGIAQRGKTKGRFV
jgi:hypothetical protein